MTRARILRFALLACVVVGLAWVRQLPLQAGLVELSDPELARILAEQDDEIRYLAPDGRQHVYLGRLDSYLWLRSARNLLDHGTPCDAIVDGKCRNTFSHAPVGRPMFYARSLHPRAIAALHRLITAFAPDFPLPSTAFWVQVLLGAACALPAFAIGRALAGDVGGFAAAIVVGLNPIFLERSIGGDNDVWQVLLPLCMVWAAVRALLSERSAGALAFAAVAGLFGGLHAADWSGWIFAWAALLCGLIATALLQAVVRRSGRGALIAVVFYVTAGLVATLAGTRESYVAAPLDVLGRAASTALAWRPVPAPAADGIAWPNNFAYVQEVQVADFDTIVSEMGGATLAAVSVIGLLLLAVPKLAPRRQSSAARPPIGPGVLVAVWLLAAFAAAFDGHRWSLLLAAPFGLAFGVAVGRLYRAVDAGTQGRSDGVRWTLRGAALLAVLGLLVAPVRNGVALASGITPRMNDAWWDALSHIRETAPADAIVTTPWDFGYWASYVGERRVTADGGSLRTQLPYWIARVLVAPSDREATGLLRMLACGSDARPFPEGGQGAYAKLRAAGVSGADAVDWIGELARLDRGGAESLLAERRLEPDVAADVLASTHCTPPPTYLVLSTSILRGTAWLHLGGWDLREGAAGALGPRVPSWVRCRPEPGGVLACPTRDALLEPGAGGGKAPVARIVWDPSVPFAQPLRLGAAGSEYLERGTPGLLLVAGAEGTDRIVFGSPTHPDLALLLDPERGRYFLGSPRLVRSTYVRLMLRGAPGSERFEKVFERRVDLGERVTVWRVRWPEEG